MITAKRGLFELGKIVATPGAMEHISLAFARDVLGKHISGDYGDICAEDATLNDHAVHDGGRILSAYITPAGVKIWVITEADRSVTTFLLPDEY